ncbi:hypothetical protein [Sulfitobacter guttiformis]|uniref:Uncharacterized protein n=1 Tax=Sulfitobacter guttiformis TaxID=74349 RepID=A0A420DHW4_9RHOB|nr:hypothetical protein [Sulfitobacter guttiformis]KIN72429.1 hypothetical protein Z949_1602 [Sulfitobacter guttiformis KCTC 32187]RKE93819.1 hypothetical protein C8N30_2917 [Sulfitobacter guttiformis]
MPKLFKETGVAAVIYLIAALGFGFGLEADDGWPEAVLSALIFAGFYFVVGLVIRWFKGRNS